MTDFYLPEPVGEYPDCQIIGLPAAATTPVGAGRDGSVELTGTVSAPVPPISETETLRAELARYAGLYTELLVEHGRVAADHSELVAEVARLQTALTLVNADYADLKADFEAFSMQHKALEADRDYWRSRFYTLESRGTL